MSSEVTPELVRLMEQIPPLLRDIAAACLQVCEERDRLREQVERAGPSLRHSTTRAVMDELAHREAVSPALLASLREALGGSDV